RLDTVNVPPGGDVVIRFTYERPSTAGPFVYHCHVLFHEDSGMMANVVLHGPATADASATAPAHGHAGSRP
ncbi:MAG TPA: multicopper oxidase domain-containing protein, partial [Longimicrobium sp.]|nr:multicopper oxidase domain-containing protein [Longimicrobium sp.]